MTTRRRDWAVVLARGESSRMGRPKGACRLPGDRTTFLERVCDLHRGADHAVAVVTLPELAPIYADCVPASSVDDWIRHPRGGGTAASCLAAVERLASRATHLWFHPVDLPLVATDTLRRLSEASRATPGRIVVPRHAGVRGHPVVTPLTPWLGLRPDAHDGPMRALIDRCGAAVHYLDLPDPGICRDFDHPDDLTGPGGPAP